MNDFPDKIVTEEELVARGAHHHPFPGGADGAEGAQLHDQVGITSLVLGPGVLVQIVREIQPGLLYLVLLTSTSGKRKTEICKYNQQKRVVGRAGVGLQGKRWQFLAGNMDRTQITITTAYINIAIITITDIIVIMPRGTKGRYPSPLCLNSA